MAEQANYITVRPPGALGIGGRRPQPQRQFSPAEEEEIASLYLREKRANIYKRELQAYQSYRDSGQMKLTDRQITEKANIVADAVMAGDGLPTGEELQKWRSQREASRDMQDARYVDRIGTRVAAGTANMQARTADFLTSPIQAVAGRDKADYFQGTAPLTREVLNVQGQAAAENSSGMLEDVVTGMIGLAADPAFVGTYLRAKSALGAANAARGANAARVSRLNVTDDIIAGGAADLVSSGIRTDFDPEQMKEEFGYGIMGAVGGEALARGVGAAWRKVFADKPLPKSQGEAVAALDKAAPDWRKQAETLEGVGAATRELQDEVDNVRIVEAEKQAAKYDPGQRIQVPEPGAKRGIDRFLDRQQARDAALQKGLDAPHIAKDKQARSVTSRLEAENDGGKVLDFEAEQARIRQDLRDESLKDPDIFEEVNELEKMGMSREEAEAMVVFGDAPPARAAGDGANPLIPAKEYPNKTGQIVDSSPSGAVNPRKTPEQYPKDSSNPPSSDPPKTWKDDVRSALRRGDKKRAEQITRNAMEGASFEEMAAEARAIQQLVKSEPVWMVDRADYVARMVREAEAKAPDSYMARGDAAGKAKKKAESEWDEAVEKSYIAGEQTSQKPRWAKTGEEWASHPSGPGPAQSMYAAEVKAALDAGKPVPDEALRSAGIARPGDQPTLGLQSGLGSPQMLDDMVMAAVKAGKFAKPHVIAGASWAMRTAGDAISTMRDFAQVMIEKFGRAIRKHVPEMWERFKGMQARQSEMRQRTQLLRQKGGIDLRNRMEARSNKKQIEQAAAADPNSALGRPRNFEKDSPLGAVGDAGRFAKQTFDYALDPIRYRAERLSPKITKRLYDYRVDANETRHNFRSEIDPYLNDRLVLKLPKDARNRLNSALINRKTDEISDIVDQLPESSSEAVAEFLDKSHKVLDEIYRQKVDAGIPVEYLEDHYPRVIKRSKLGKLRERLHGEEKSQLDDAIKRYADQKYNGETKAIPPDELGEIVHGVIAMKPSLIKDPKTRRVANVNDELLQYYEPFDVAMDAYIERSAREIAKAKLLGMGTGLRLGDESDFVHSIGRMVAEEGLKGKDADEMIGLIRSILVKGESPVGGMTKGLRSFGYIAMMGNIYSTIRQIDDYAMSSLLFGPVNTLRGAYRNLPGVGKSEITALEMGMDRIGEEFAAGGSQKAVDLTFKMTFLKYLERHIKDTALNAALIKNTNMAKKNPERFRRQWQPFFGEKTDELINDLSFAAMTNNKKTMLVMELGRLQPTTGLEVPQGYHDARAAFDGPMAGMPVLAYQLRTFGMLRMGTLRRESFKDMAQGLQSIREGRKPEGVQEFLSGAAKLTAMVAALTASGTAVDQLIGWLRGDDETLSGSMFDSLLGLAMQNRYTVDQAKRSGASGYVSVFAPPSVPTLMDLILADPARMMDGRKIKSLRRIPLIGRLVEDAVYGDGDGNPNAPKPPKPPSPPKPPKP